MRFNAFDLIVNKLDEALNSKGFTQDAEDASLPEGTAVIFRSEDILYGVLYNEKAKRFELRCAAAEDEPQWKNISVWLFDPESDPMSEAESIASEFADSVQGSKKPAAVQNVKKKKKNEENTSDPVFFFNRLVNIFPELKDEMNGERIQYGQIRAFTFSKENALPKIRGLVANYSTSDICKKLAEVLSDMYKNGDMDTRSIITSVIINGLSADEAEKLIPMFDDSLKAAALAERKLIGKKIKPEKKKKQKKITAASLNDITKY